jgi:hypothetical protein
MAMNVQKNRESRQLLEKKSLLYCKKVDEETLLWISMSINRDLRMRRLLLAYSLGTYIQSSSEETGYPCSALY